MSPFRLRIGRTALLVVALAALTAVSSEARDTATLITVTTSADESNGPAGGISLREAIQTTNSAPGQYLIRFAPGLGPIDLASELPRLTGGGVTIDGEATIAGTGGWGLIVSSSDNQIDGLTLEGFDRGIGLLPTGSNAAYRRNVISDNTIGGAGIFVSAGCCGASNNVVDDVQILRNTIDAPCCVGIGVIGADDGGDGIHASSGDRVSNLTIDSNTILIRDGELGDAADTGAILLLGSRGQEAGLVTHGVVTNNQIEGPAPGVALIGGAGAPNALDRPEVAGNEVSDVRVGGNAVAGYRTAGIRAWGASACLTSSSLRDNRVEALVITGNHLDTATSLAPGIDVLGAKSCGPAATQNRAEAIWMSGNTIGGNDSIRIVGGEGTGAVDNSAAGVLVGPNDRAGSLVLAPDSAGASGNHLGAVVAPSVSYPSPSATAITSGSATVAAIVDAFGADTTYRFEYGTSPAYGQTTATATFLNGPQQASAQLGGLAPATTYHFRLVAENRAGHTSGADQTFTTLPIAPELAYRPVKARRTRATLRTNLDAHGAEVEWWVRYGRTRRYGHSTRVRAAGPDTGTVLVELRKLRPRSLYHYSFVARNAGGTTTGPDARFRTRH
jgi:hypothetical protein